MEIADIEKEKKNITGWGVYLSCKDDGELAEIVSFVHMQRKRAEARKGAVGVLLRTWEECNSVVSKAKVAEKAPKKVVKKKAAKQSQEELKGYVCKCGFGSLSKRGIAIHKAKCKKKGVKASTPSPKISARITDPQVRKDEEKMASFREEYSEKDLDVVRCECGNIIPDNYHHSLCSSCLSGERP